MKEISEYGKLQREIRTIAKMSIRELAELSGVSHSYLSQVENGTRPTPSKEIIKKIAEALNYDYFVLAVSAGIIDEKEIYLETLKDQLQDLQNNYSLFVATLQQIKEITSEFGNKNEIPEELIIHEKELEEQLTNIEAEMDKTEEKINAISDGAEEFDLVVFDDKMDIQSRYLRFKFPKYEKVKINNGFSRRIIPESEARQRFLSLENLFTMNENIYYNRKPLTKHQRDQLIRIAEIIFGDEREE